jgi:hypothetical protein
VFLATPLYGTILSSAEFNEYMALRRSIKEQELERIVAQKIVDIEVLDFALTVISFHTRFNIRFKSDSN